MAQIGDWLVQDGDSGRAAQIIGLPHADGSPPYVIRWQSTGHIALVFPGPFTRIAPGTIDATADPTPRPRQMHGPEQRGARAGGPTSWPSGPEAAALKEPTRQACGQSASRLTGARCPADERKPNVFEVRIHGRGSQGVVTAAELLAAAAFAEGRYAQAFPSFGSERTGPRLSLTAGSMTSPSGPASRFCIRMR